MTEKQSEHIAKDDLDVEKGRYTLRPTEAFEAPQFDFARLNAQLNQNFEQLTTQLTMMHTDLAQALNDNMTFLREKMTQESNHKP
ncbi:hypothetical protein GCM10007938_29190 [Vibrio zhanjiangensis]|uniref:Uncharacterized protein n=1 Tax=Vibrio zhanjiangensis TaxID=1046128 RepID=A0ABQ6F367_9VIBR|nr:hypothetical protein [Vibrio zhanjiangensis]GLT19137.1 hypothetical protein GCM10007938_29190 [Vibrio zhanjiangensis]